MQSKKIVVKSVYLLTKIQSILYSLFQSTNDVNRLFVKMLGYDGVNCIQEKVDI